MLNVSVTSIPVLSIVIPDGSRGAFRAERADPGPTYSGIRRKALQGYMGPGSRALGRSAGMTIEKRRMLNGGCCGSLHV
jgi:hypothetical protein